MTKLVFETAAFTDAIKKAAKIAPSSAGQAFDKAAGIIFEVDPYTDAPCIIKATNLDIFFMEWLTTIEAEGDKCVWRLPSQLLAQVVSSLPIGTGRSIILEEKDNGLHSQIHLKSGRTTARFNLLQDDYYPKWAPFDPSVLVPVMDMGGRMTQIEWAAAKAEEPLSGVNLDGEYAVATDRFRMARVPLKLPVLLAPGESVTVPSGVLSSLLKSSGEISVAIDGGQLLIMPDEYSQIRAILYGIAYPDLKRAMSRDLPDSFTVRKEALLGIMNRANSFSGNNRLPTLECFIGKEEFAVMMTNDETGLLGDVIELPGQADHDRVHILFTPKNIMDPIEHAPSDQITVFYNHSNSRSPVKIDGGSGYEAWGMPRTKLSGD